ncbi:MAG: winged helix-turn-helix transcriptional regulator [Terriglobales bacterium]
MALEIFGDRWSLLIVRDIMVRGYRTFQEFLTSGEGIASNILSARLKRLTATGILAARRAADDRRKIQYELTEKGIDLAPAVLEIFLWSARYEATAAPEAIVEDMAQRKEILAEIRRRWAAHDVTPILPPFRARTS